MIKKYYIRKIYITILVFITLFLIYLMPSSQEKNKYLLNTTNIEYTYNNAKETVYLLDSNNYIARTTINGCNCQTKETAKDALESLIIDGKKNNSIPNGFRSIIPSGTEILNIDLENKILTINFSKELLDINEKYEEKMLEAIIYTLTSIDGIDGIIIKVEGKQLEKLPNSQKKLPTTLTKKYGINKEYDIINTSNIDYYTVYYVSNYNDNKYYVPVTKYINNNNKDKIKLIINELSTSPIYETNLMSYLNSNVSLLDYDIEDNILKLNFNNSILSNNNDKILEEVIYTISLSVNDNYNIKEISFLVDNKEIYKNSLKTIE